MYLYTMYISNKVKGIKKSFKLGNSGFSKRKVKVL